MESAYEIIENIIQRYERYSRFLSYPGDWGERAFRGWLVFDLFHTYLGWPIKNIVFGETYDVLLVDDEVKPIINIETKKPKKGLADYTDFVNRLKHYQTLYYAILTDGYDWLCHDCRDGPEITFTFRQGDEKFKTFIKPFWSKRYLYGDKK